MSLIKQLPKSVKELIQPGRLMMFSKVYCPYCDMAKELLHQHSIPFYYTNVDEIGLTKEQELELHTLGKIKTYPNMFIGETPIGGFQNLNRLHGSGKLWQMLTENNIPFKQQEQE